MSIPFSLSLKATCTPNFLSDAKTAMINHCWRIARRFWRSDETLKEIEGSPHFVSQSAVNEGSTSAKGRERLRTEQTNSPRLSPPSIKIHSSLSCRMGFHRFPWTSNRITPTERKERSSGKHLSTWHHTERQEREFIDERTPLCLWTPRCPLSPFQRTTK